MHFAQVALLAALARICASLPRLGAEPPGIRRSSPPAESSGRKLKGKFLHITDVHPDPFYKVYTSTEEEKACHRGEGPAGIYGAETSACDSPVSLLDETFKWINRTIKDEIDFIVWTGDSARHDNDEKIPRSKEQIVTQNELLVDRFLSVFGKPENYDDDDPTNDFVIPIIPTFGNNDVLPHNVFKDGPNTWTRKYLDIWRQFIPEAQRHQFQRGGWFYVEVIPNKLAVFSLNTLYFFASNAAVDGCAIKGAPGYEHMDWLRIQLELLRRRGMKALITGHVPPARVDSKTSWEESCWQKYALWQKQYRDVILASIYGHMNIDHFMLQDFKDIDKHVKKGLAAASNKPRETSELTIASATDYLSDLRSTFAEIPNVISSVKHFEAETLSWGQKILSFFFKSGKKTPTAPLKEIGGPFGERYSMAFVSSSVVPNFFPTLRVFEYNITGLESVALPESRLPRKGDAMVAEADDQLNASPKTKPKHDKNEDTSKKRPKRYKFTVPKAPSKSTPPGPAYSPQTLTLLGYTHYYANLTYINHDFHHDNSTNEDIEFSDKRWKEGKHSGKAPPKSKPDPKPFKFDVLYSTFDDKVYKLRDLTVRSYLRLARRMALPPSKTSSSSSDVPAVNVDEDGERELEVVELEDDLLSIEKKKGKHRKKHKKKKVNKVWFTFVKRAFVGTMDAEDIEDQFGSEVFDVPDEIPVDGDDGSLEL